MVQPVYNCDEDALGRHLENLFAEGAKEVEIVHPSEGRKVITRAEYERLKQRLYKAKHSPADRVKLAAQLERKRNLAQLRLTDAMMKAQTERVDIGDETPEGFGKNVSGQSVDIENRVFLHVANYPPMIPPLAGEVGALLDQDWARPPIRILQVTQ